MAKFPRKKMGIFSLTGCEGCQFELLGYFDHFAKLSMFFEINQFRLGQANNNYDIHLDIAVIEGSACSDPEIKELKEIRRASDLVIAMGSCACLGGIQSQRARFKAAISPKPVLPINKIIKTDYIIPGCPVSHTELYSCLMDAYWGNKKTYASLGVCFECKQNGNKCLLKNGKPCLGPITSGGCNSICPNNHQSCFGCRGRLPYSNAPKMKEILGNMLEKEEIENLLTMYGQYNNNLSEL